LIKGIGSIPFQKDAASFFESMPIMILIAKIKQNMTFAMLYFAERLRIAAIAHYLNKIRFRDIP